VSWRTDKLEKFLVIHQGHPTGLCTMEGYISIEQIPDANNSLIIGFNNWLHRINHSESDEMLKANYILGLKLAMRIKALVGKDISVDYWWANPVTIGTDSGKMLEALRIKKGGYITVPADKIQGIYMLKGLMPASPFTVPEVCGPYCLN